jgi:hypothetical protein
MLMVETKDHYGVSLGLAKTPNTICATIVKSNVTEAHSEMVQAKGSQDVA